MLGQINNRHDERREERRRIEDIALRDRVEAIEYAMLSNAEEHKAIVEELRDVATRTQQVVDNTAEIVTIFRGLSSLRTAVMFGAPLAAAFMGVVGIAAWVAGAK